MEIQFTVEGKSDKDYYPRAHGFSADEILEVRFWETQPALVLSRGAAKTFSKSILKDLEPGEHFVTYGVSAHSTTPWTTKIMAGDRVIAEGPNSYGNFLSAPFILLPSGRTRTVPALGGRIPFFANLRIRIMSIFGW